MHRNAVSLIETLARHPLHHTALDTDTCDPKALAAVTARTLRLWAQLSRAIQTFPKQARDTEAALRKQALGYAGQDAQRSAEALAAADVIATHTAALALLA